MNSVTTSRHAVGTANPGSQKLSLNSAVYASVTVAVFNALAMTNFDANTILSLLTTGNRIYIQQRNDASKAVVYEVTGPGTNLTGYWTIPVTIIQSRGTLFSANADLNCVFILSVSSSSLANPTGTRRPHGCQRQRDLGDAVGWSARLESGNRADVERRAYVRLSWVRRDA